MNTDNNPYIGPRAFLREDGHLFFGREREERDLLSLVVSHRLVLFYAQSGAGKSSLVNTRLIPGLEKKGYIVFPLGRVSGEPPSSHTPENIYVHNLMRSLVQRKIDSSTLKGLSLKHFLAGLNEDENGYYLDSELVQKQIEADKRDHAQEQTGGDGSRLPKCALIIDQFEELFSTHQEAWEKRENFFIQLAQAMEKFQNLWVILVMREDFIASLDPYAHLLPDGLRTRYYMQRLDREAALSAIKKPVQDLRPYSEGVAEKLVEDLSSVSFQKPDKEIGWEPGQYVEPVQLQVVCYSLWENLSPTGRKITDRDRKTVGDVNEALGKYYAKRVKEVAKEKRVKERLIREWFEKELIISGEIRNIVMQKKDKGKGDLDDFVIQALQSDLVRGEKRGGVTWYELTHDRLVKPIIENNQEWFNEHLGPLQRRAALWHEHDHDGSWLLLDDDLSEAEKWAKENPGELTSVDKKFLRACRKQQKQKTAEQEAQKRELEMAQKLADEQARVARQAQELALTQQQAAEQAHEHAIAQELSAKRAHRLSRFAFSLLAVALVFGGFAVWGMLSAVQSTNKAESAKATAESAKVEAEDLRDIAHARELASLANEYQDSQLDTSILISIEAYTKKTNIPETQNAIISSMQKAGPLMGFLTDSQNPASGIKYSPDGKILSVQGEESVAIWDIEWLEKYEIDAYPTSDIYFSPDSKILAISDHAGIHLWDLANRIGITEQPVNHHIGQVERLKFSSNNTVLTSIGENGSVGLWRLSDGQYTSIETSISGNNFNISPDGRILAVIDFSGTLSFWDTATGSPLLEDIQGDETIFSPDSKSVLVIDTKEGSFSLWSLETIEQIIKPIRGNSPILSRDQLTVAYTNLDGSITLRNIKSAEVRELPPLEPSISPEILFNPNGKSLLASVYGKVVLFDIAQNDKKIIEITEELDPKFSADGDVLVTTRNGEIVFRNTTTGKEIASTSGNEATFSPSGKVLGVTDYGDNILLWEPVKGTQIGEPLNGDRVIFSPDENLMALIKNETPDEPGSITIQYTATGELIGEPISLEVDVSTQTGIDVMFVDNKNLLFPNSQDTISIWNADKEKVSTSYSLKSGTISEISLSNDKGILALGSTDGKITLWPISERVPTQELSTHNQGLIQTVQFSPDGNWMISSARDGVVVMYAATGKKLYSLSGETFLALSPDNKALATKKEDKISLWNLPEGTKIGSSFEGDEIVFDPNGSIFAVKDVENKITLHSQTTGTILSTGDNSLEGFIEGFSPDGKYLAIYSVDEYYDQKYFELWNMRTRSPIGEPIAGEVLIFSPDSKMIATFDAANSYLPLHNTKDLTFITDFYYPYTEPKISFSPDSNYMAINGTYTYSYGYDPYMYDYGYDPYMYDRQIDPYSYAYSTSSYPSGSTLYDLRTHAELALTGYYTAFSPDSKRIASIDETGGITLWDIENFNPIGESLNGHSGEINHIELSPDGQTLASQGIDGGVILWDATGQWTFGVPLGNDDQPALNAAISPDGSTRAIFSKKSNEIILQDTTFGVETIRLQNDHILNIIGTSFSSNDSVLAATGDDGQIFLYEVASGKRTGESIEGYIVGYSHNGKVFVIGDNNTITFRDTTSGENIFEAPSDATFIGFSADDKVVVFQDSDGGIYFLDLDTKAEKSTSITGSYQGFSPNGNFIVTGENDTFSLWDTATGSRVGDPIPGYFTLFSPNEKSLAFFLNDQMGLWNITTQKQVGNMYPGYYPYYNTDGTILSFTSYDEKTYTYVTTNIDTTTGATLSEEIEGEYPIISPNGNTVITYTYWDENYSLWEVESGKKIGTIPISEGAPAFTADSKTIYVLNTNGVKVWDATTASLKYSISGENIILSPDNRVAAQVNNDGTLTIWDLSTGKVKNHSPNLYPANGKWLSFSSTGNFLAIYGTTGVVLWDISKGETITQTPIQEYLGIPQKILFSPDGNLLATQGQDGIIVWNLENRARMAKIQDPSATISTMSFSPTSDNLIYYTSDGKTYIWNKAKDTLEQAGLLEGTYSTCPTALSQDGKYLAYGIASKIYIKNIETNEEIKEPVELLSYCPSALAFSPSGDSLVYGDIDKIYRVDWENNYKVELNGNGIFYNINDITYIREGDKNDLIAARSDEGRISLWDLENRSIIGTSFPGDFQGLTSNQSIFLYRDANGQVNALNLAPEALKTTLDRWKDELCQKVRRNLTPDEWVQFISTDEEPRPTCPQWPMQNAQQAVP